MVWKTCAFFQIFGTLVVASRFYVRSPLFKGPGLGWDDYMMGATYAFYTVGIAVAIKSKSSKAKLSYQSEISVF